MTPFKIVIVGGGTAGWMCANLMAKRWSSQPIAITVIESSAIGTVGVGEGSTPFLREFFAQLGLTEKDWMPACSATYKCGIDFPGWCGESEPQSYFHPFYAEADASTVPAFFDACLKRRDGANVHCHPDDFFITGYLSRDNKAPTRQGRSVHGVDYGYHFDSAKLGAFLREHAIKQNVEHIDARVEQVSQHPDGAIAAVTLDDGRLLEGNFFVDCSGFRSLLLRGTLNEAFIDYSDYLPNNRAVALQQPYEQTQNAIASTTISRGLENGWMWSIPLQNRFGHGYVYCDSFLDKTVAEERLRQVIDKQDGNALHLQWTPGRLENNWRKNCVAIGLSQGFLEPLEAPMLNIIQHSCTTFIDLVERGNFSDQYRDYYNKTINNLVDGTRDYLQAHYVLNTRKDTEYWRSCRENPTLSDALRAFVKAWDSGAAPEQAMQKYQDVLVYQRTSWYCIFSGMGRFSGLDAQAPKPKQPEYEEISAVLNEQSKLFDDHAKHLSMMQ